MFGKGNIKRQVYHGHLIYLMVQTLKGYLFKWVLWDNK